MHNDTLQQEKTQKSPIKPNKELLKGAFNFLTYEDNRLPIPEVIKNYRDDWEKHEFYITNDNVTGLNVGQEFLIFGDRLYKLTGGTSLLDYTGELTFGDYISMENGDYRVAFKVLLLKGEVKEVTLEACEEQNQEERIALTNKLIKEVNKEIKRENSWWFKYLYIPYRFLAKLLYRSIYLLLYVVQAIIVLIFKILIPW